MAGLRIRWRTALRALALIVAAPLVSLRALPPLLEPGAPPPPAADVGLPGAGEIAARPLPEPERRSAAISPARALGPRDRARPADAARRRNRSAGAPRPALSEPTIPPEPTPPAPAPAPAAAPVPAPTPPPADGSLEFMPH